MINKQPCNEYLWFECFIEIVPHVHSCVVQKYISKEEMDLASKIKNIQDTGQGNSIWAKTVKQLVWWNVFQAFLTTFLIMLLSSNQWNNC